MLQEQKAKLQQHVQQQDKQPLSKKECWEVRDLLEVNIALLEVLEESDPDELKKKRIQAAKKATSGTVSLRTACRLLGGNRSTVYKQRQQQNNPCQRRLDDEKLGEKIKQIQEKHRYTYGMDRVTHEIRRQGENVNQKRVARLMPKFGINAVIRKNVIIFALWSKSNSVRYRATF